MSDFDLFLEDLLKWMAYFFVAATIIAGIFTFVLLLRLLLG